MGLKPLGMIAKLSMCLAFLFVGGSGGANSASAQDDGFLYKNTLLPGSNFE